MTPVLRPDLSAIIAEAESLFLDGDYCVCPKGFTCAETLNARDCASLIALFAAARVGPLHADWDLISDCEALLAGRKSVLPPQVVIAMALEAIVKRRKKQKSPAAAGDVVF
jgi:hypothetical protein